MTFGDSAAYWAPKPLPVCEFLWPGHDTDSRRVRTGQTQATAPHTRPPYCSSWRACASDALQAARVASEAGTTCSCCTSRSCTECARSVCHGHRLRHCSRAARRRRSISRASKASAHCAYAAGTWQSMAAHRLWRLVCHRQCCQSLTCVLEPQQAAAAAAAAACCCLISQASGAARRAEIAWFCRS